MSFLKVLIIVLVGMFTLTAVNAGSISIQQVGQYQLFFNVSYEYNGKLLTNSSGVLVMRDSKTIEIPNEAVKIILAVYKKSPEPVTLLFTKFYPSLDKKCFKIYDWEEVPSWFEEPCQKLPAYKGFSISVNQTERYPLFYDLTYEFNDSNLTETSQYFLNKHFEKARIPNGVKNINFTLYSDISTMYSRKKIVLTQFYPAPIEKCFTIYGRGDRLYWIETPCRVLPALNGNSITVHQTGNRSTSLLKIEYHYVNTNLTEYVGGISDGQNGTIQIPDGATNINVTIYREWYTGSTTWIYGNIHLVFSKFYASPVKKCFQLFSYVGTVDDPCFEISCQKIPADNGHSISVYQSANFSAIFEVMYEYNGLNLTESPGIFSIGQYKTVELPYYASKINVTFYGYHSKDFTRSVIGSEFFPSPVKKCFILIKGYAYKSDESCESLKSTNPA